MTQQNLHSPSYQEQATNFVWKAIALQQEAMVLLKQADLLGMQATALLTEQSGAQQQTLQLANHQSSRSPEVEEKACVSTLASLTYQDDDDWDEWVAARFVFAGDA